LTALEPTSESDRPPGAEIFYISPELHWTLSLRKNQAGRRRQVIRGCNMFFLNSLGVITPASLNSALK